MTRKLLNILFIFGIAWTSCRSTRELRKFYEYELYIDYKNVSYQGQNSTQSLYFEIDSTNGMRYYGKLIVDDKDTLTIHGFKKGDVYETFYRTPDTQNSGRLQIRTQGKTRQIRDSLQIRDTKAEIIKEVTILYRRPRKTCI